MKNNTEDRSKEPSLPFQFSYTVSHPQHTAQWIQAENIHTASTVHLRPVSLHSVCTSQIRIFRSLFQ